MIEPGDILPDDMMIMPETGEVVPQPIPGQYTKEGVPYWDFGPGDVFPMTGEVIPEGSAKAGEPGCARIYCGAPHLLRPPPPTKWIDRFVAFMNRVWP